MNTPTISIVIPTYNRSAMLRNTMACMTAQETDDRFTYEILVIDDASTDDTAAVVREIIAESPVPVRYIYGEGRGYTGVLNRAVAEFSGQWLAFFDDDQLTHHTWLKQLYDAALQQDADMVGGPIQLDLPESVLAGIGPVCRDLYGESPEIRNPELYTEHPPLPSGGNRLVRRRVFEEIGTFDESMLTGGCDRDFLLRARAAGVTMAWAPGAAGRHLIPPERISYKHVKWYSLQWGCSFAYIDRKRLGLFKTALSAVARIGQALLINMPGLLLARLRGDGAEMLDRQALLWRAVGYVRKTLQMIAPKIFVQEEFFSRVEFRRAQENT
jgi:glycosyltransferase involved in cell wall biosynthesis